ALRRSPTSNTCRLACWPTGTRRAGPVASAPRHGKTGRGFFVRPAWAHSCGCKSRHKLITANEVKRNCTRATECGKEAWNVSGEPMNKNRIRGAAKQGERARNREAL